jgi:hypothetical protein
MQANPGTGAMPRRQGNSTRTLTPAIAQLLKSAAAAFAEDPAAADEGLRAAIVTAVSEAHQQEWRGEDLLTALRATTAELTDLDPRQREAVDLTIRRRATIAFFGANDAAF